MASQYIREDQMKIEDALRDLHRVIYEEVGNFGSYIKIFDNGDMEAHFLIDEEGSVFHIEISNDENRVVKEHMHIADSSFSCIGEE